MSTQRRGTSTSAFGVSRREGHDSSAFYERFKAPTLSDDATVAGRRDIDEIFVGDSRDMNKIDDGSVALVVTSPPYFAGKEYEAVLGEGHVPESYVSYLAMLRDVFSECVRTLEPGGRIAVNVANLGRKPYRSLSSDIIGILQNDLGLLLRGEIIWQKQRGASGSCAWGSFQRPSNPVLRDLTERIIVASKGRFDRAQPAGKRAKNDLPSVATISRDEFMDSTLDVWEIHPESATRVGHPAPFPIELPRRLIDLYTYEGDLILDPFMGSGTTALAAIESGRHYVGYDTDPAYVDRATERIRVESSPAESPVAVGPGRTEADVADDSAGEALVRQARQDGLAARDLAALVLEQLGFEKIITKTKPIKGIDIPLRATLDGVEWYFEVAGSFLSNDAGLRRNETLYRVIAKATMLQQIDPGRAFAVFTTTRPTVASLSAAFEGIVGPERAIRAVIDLQEADLTAHASNALLL